MASPSPSPSSLLQNVYYTRKVATAKPCYVCRRPTETVLATLKADDFVYTCEGHLTDPGFATPIAAPAPPPGPSPGDIRKVISDYTAREARKAEKEKKDGKDKDKDDKSDDKDKEKEKEKSKDKDAVTTPTLPSPSLSSPPAAAPSHRKFALHRALFETRKTEMRKREQGARAREVTRGMPQVPRGAF